MPIFPVNYKEAQVILTNRENQRNLHTTQGNHKKDQCFFFVINKQNKKQMHVP